MSVEKAIYSRLTNYANLQALISDRVFFDVLDQSATMPAVVFSRISTERFPAMGSNVGVAKARIQVAAYDDTGLGAITTAVQVKAALDRWSGTAGGVVVQHIFIDAEFEEYDPDSKKHRSVLDFLVWFQE